MTPTMRPDPDRQVVRVRPYALTGGRTRAQIDLPIEAMLLTNQRGHDAMDTVAVDSKRILELATSPISLAEVSAHLNTVIGVARILVADLVAGGLIDATTAGGAVRPDAQLLERVFNGLKAL